MRCGRIWPSLQPDFSWVLSFVCIRLDVTDEEKRKRDADLRRLMLPRQIREKGHRVFNFSRTLRVSFIPKAVRLLCGCLYFS